MVPVLEDLNNSGDAGKGLYFSLTLNSDWILACGMQGIRMAFQILGK